MKENNRKKVKIIATLNAIVVAVLVPSMIVILMSLSSLFDTGLISSPIYEFVTPFVPIILLLAPIAMVISIVLAVIGVVWSKGGVLDREYSKFNLKFEVALLIVNLLTVAVFYWFFNASNHLRDHSLKYDTPSCNSIIHSPLIKSVDCTLY